MRSYGVNFYRGKKSEVGNVKKFSVLRVKIISELLAIINFFNKKTFLNCLDIVF